MPVATQAAITVNGTAGTDFGSPLSVQNNPTGFGDSTAGTTTPTDGGSEIDAAYGIIQNNTLYLVFAGNLEGNYNKLDVFVDSVAGQGQNSLVNNNVATSDLQRISADPMVVGGVGLTFDAGFVPDYYVSANGGGSPYTFYVNMASLPTAGAGTAFYLGNTTVTGPSSNGTLTGGDVGAPAVLAAIDSSNKLGVTGTSITGAASVTTGVELAIPLSAIGNPTGAVNVCAFVNSSSGDFMSNQVVGGINGFNGGANLGEPRAVNFANIPGQHYFVVAAAQQAPTLVTFTIKPSTVPGSLKAVGKVTISAASTSATAVSLSNTNASATVPAAVTIPAGMTSATFNITTMAVSTKVVGTVTATLGSKSIADPLTVRPISVLKVVVNPTTVKAGGTSTGTVTLEAPAAPGGITVTLTSSKAAATLSSASIVIPAGMSTGTFTITTHPVAANTAVVIKATANGLSKAATLTVTP